MSQVIPLLQQLYRDYLDDNDLDVMVYPTVPLQAPFIGQETLVQGGTAVPIFDVVMHNSHYTPVIGAPTLTLPIGQGPRNLPLGGIDVLEDHMTTGGCWPLERQCHACYRARDRLSRCSRCPDDPDRAVLFGDVVTPESAGTSSSHAAGNLHRPSVERSWRTSVQTPVEDSCEDTSLLFLQERMHVAALNRARAFSGCCSRFWLDQALAIGGKKTPLSRPRTSLRASNSAILPRRWHQSCGTSVPSQGRAGCIIYTS